MGRTEVGSRSVLHRLREVARGALGEPGGFRGVARGRGEALVGEMCDAGLQRAAGEGADAADVFARARAGELRGRVRRLVLDVVVGRVRGHAGALGYSISFSREVEGRSQGQDTHAGKVRFAPSRSAAGSAPRSAPPGRGCP